MKAGRGLDGSFAALEFKVGLRKLQMCLPVRRGIPEFTNISPIFYIMCEVVTFLNLSSNP